MKTASGYTMAVVWVLASAAGLVLATAGTASAEPPITSTVISTFSESFSDEPFLCQDELYVHTVSLKAVEHITFFPDTGAVHFHDDVHGKVVAVPVDGTGPTYTGNLWFSDRGSIRAVKSGDLLVEHAADFNHVVARGSDGSKVLFDFHAHFTVNANGEMSADFDTIRAVCS
jgi:hypothetical protein